MENYNNKELMLEVRKAYRLLFDYQSKLLALVNYIGSKYGYSYNGGYPKFSGNQPRQGGGSLKQWAWDWLNLYYHEFHFGGKVLEDGSKLIFSIFCLNDDGYFLARQRSDEKIDKREVAKFEKPGLSHSKLIFVVGHNIWTSEIDFTGSNWNSPTFTLDEKGLQETTKGKMFFKSYSLENFFYEEAVLDQLTDFETECSAIGIPFSMVEMKIS